MTTDVHHRAEFQLPGFMFTENVTREIPTRDDADVLAVAPDHAFAFRVCDVPAVVPNMDGFTVTPIPYNWGPRTFIGGDVFDVDMIESDDRLRADLGLSDDRTLIANARSNGWPRVIRCRTGNWQPFEDDDRVVEP